MSFLSEQRQVIQRRLRELRPYVEEAERLERVLDALGGPTTDRRSRRNMRLEDRKSQVVALVADYPGLRRKQIAEHLDLTAARAGQIVNGLLAEGTLRDEGGSIFLPGGTDG